MRLTARSTLATLALLLATTAPLIADDALPGAELCGGKDAKHWAKILRRGKDLKAGKQAIAALRRIGPGCESVASDLGRMATARDQNHRNAIRDLLVQLDTASSRKQVLSALKSSKTDYRQGLIDSLRDHYARQSAVPEEVLRQVAKLTDDDDAYVAESACEALGAWGWRARAELRALTAALTSDESKVCDAAGEALAKHGEAGASAGLPVIKKVVARLRSGLNKAKGAKKSAASAKILRLEKHRVALEKRVEHGGKSRKAWERELKAKQPEQRVAACKALAEMRVGAPTLIAIAVGMLEDDDASVRQHAFSRLTGYKQLLGQLAPDALAKLLAYTGKQTQRQDGIDPQRLVNLVAELRAPEAVPVLLALYRADNAFALPALKRMGPSARAAAGELATIMTDANDRGHHRDWAFEALAAVGPAPAEQSEAIAAKVLAVLSRDEMLEGLRRDHLYNLLRGLPTLPASAEATLLAQLPAGKELSHDSVSGILALLHHYPKHAATYKADLAAMCMGRISWGLRGELAAAELAKIAPETPGLVEHITKHLTYRTRTLGPEMKGRGEPGDEEMRVALAGIKALGPLDSARKKLVQRALWARSPVVRSLAYTTLNP